MGKAAFSAKTGAWVFSYENDMNCPFIHNRRIALGAYECINCPAFIQVERDRAEHQTLLSCRGIMGGKAPVEQRTIVDVNKKP
jgi:hypothetical protein